MKRAFDFTVALLGLVITSPLMAAAAIAVKLETPGPAFYSGPRVGRNGTEFRIHKLRTMRSGADRQGPAVTTAHDERVTSVGRVLRRIKADEIPQLLNVLRGEMSLVGPRPEHPQYVKQYTEEQKRVLSMRPGITSTAAIVFINEQDLLDGPNVEATYVSTVLPQKLALDLEYVTHASFAGDLKILLRTAVLLVRRPFKSGRPQSGP